MRLYTMANDRMYQFFARFIEYYEMFVPDIPLYVIPFDDDLARVGELVAAKSGVSLVTADPRIDAIGREIFATEEYRPAIPMWRYLRKLNAFVGHNEPFIFADVNTMLLCDPRPLVDFAALDPGTIWFRSLSALRRTIQSEVARDFLELLNPNCGCGNGYNCGYFSARGSFLDIEFATAMAKQNLRQFIGAAPEQGFLAIYIGFLGKTVRFIQHVSPVVGARQDDQTALFEGDDHYLRYVDGSDEGRICLSIKHTGQDFTEANDVIRNYVERRRKLDGPPSHGAQVAAASNAL